MTVDFGNLLDLTDKGLTQPVQSAVLEKAVPANLRGGKGEWFALSLRARVVYASKALGLKAITYEQLADPQVEGEVLHSFRPASLQHGAHRRLHCPSR